MIKFFNNRGFTIIELMIVVALIGILSAFAYPSFTYTIQNNRVKTAASDMHINLLMARSEAIKRNDDVVIAGIVGGWQITYGAQVLATKNDLSNEVAFACNTDADVATEACPGSVTFNRTGRPDIFLEMRFTSTVTDKIPMRCVSISLSGRPKALTDSDGDDTNGCN